MDGVLKSYKLFKRFYRLVIVIYECDLFHYFFKYFQEVEGMKPAKSEKNE
jgi:hypothetical protein